jgi:hypothetical protein
MITQELVKELFDYREDGQLIWKNNGLNNYHKGNVAGSRNLRRGYAQVKIGKDTYQTHRLIYLWHYGYIPTFLDHSNRIKTDNRIENLRAASAAQNSANASKRSRATSKWKGVSYQKSKGWYRVYISFENKPKYLGKFDCELDGATLYNFFAKELHGDFAVYNEAVQTCPLVA